MKTKTITLIIYIFIFIEQSFTRNISDTLTANYYIVVADSLRDYAQYDSSNLYYLKAVEIFNRYIKVEESKLNIFLDSSLNDYKKTTNEVVLHKIVHCYNQLGWNMGYIQQKHQTGLYYLKQALIVITEKIIEKNLQYANTYNIMATISSSASNYDIAMELFNKSVDLYVTIYGQEHLTVATGYNNIGIIYRIKGDYDLALEFQKRALSIQQKYLEPRHSHIARTYNNIGLVYRDKSDFDVAIEYFKQALTINTINLGNANPTLGKNLTNIGLIYFEKREYKNALEYYQKSLNIFYKSFGENHPSIAILYNNIGNTIKEQSEIDGESTELIINYNKVMENYNKALDINLIHFGKDHPDVGWCYGLIGNLYIDMFEYTKAFEFLQKSLLIYKNKFGNVHPYIGEAYNYIASMYVRQLSNLYYNKKTLEEVLYINPKLCNDIEKNNIINFLNKNCILLDSILIYQQFALQALVQGFSSLENNNEVNYYKNPFLKKVYSPGNPGKIEGVNDKLQLLNTLEKKAEVLEIKWYVTNILKKL